MKKMMAIFMMLILSILWSLSASNWFTMWMSMEMNSMMFIPILMTNATQSNSESGMKYFLIQSISSMLFMSSATINTCSMKLSLMTNNFMVLSLMMKLGMFPFYFWYVDITPKMDYISMTLLMTTQKMIPFITMSNLTSWNMKMKIMMMMNMVTSALLAINHNKIKIILTFSSINQMSWMMASMMINMKTFWMMMLIYVSILVPINMNMKKMKISTLTQLMKFNSKSENLMFLSLFGLPPMPGFMMKWMVTQKFMLMKEKVLPSLMIMSSAITLYYYLRMFIQSTFTKNAKTKMFKNSENKMKKLSQIMLIPTCLILMSM
uniref:NADH-ubiquinone oxidoreductase chain 2 n=1 Tax=Endeis sp. JZ-2022 TaxID=2992007 RepID=A0A9E8AE85_9CHEL|nr:NADH dehydrogenase subunit 2 [Endeis sp. JZ-2022]